MIQGAVCMPVSLATCKCVHIGEVRVMPNVLTRLCFRGLAGKLLDLIDHSDQGGWWQFYSDPSWLSCIPLLHFLQEKSLPYQDPEPSSNFKSKEWWGLTGFDRRKDSFKRSMTARR